MSTGSIVALLLLVGIAVLVAVGLHVGAKFMRRRRAADFLDVTRITSASRVTVISPRCRATLSDTRTEPRP